MLQTLQSLLLLTVLRPTSLAALIPSVRGVMALATHDVTGTPAFVVAAQEAEVFGDPHPLRERLSDTCGQQH